MSMLFILLLCVIIYLLIGIVVARHKLKDANDFDAACYTLIWPIYLFLLLGKIVNWRRK